MSSINLLGCAAYGLERDVSGAARAGVLEAPKPGMTSSLCHVTRDERNHRGRTYRERCARRVADRTRGRGDDGCVDRRAGAEGARRGVKWVKGLW